MPEPEKLAEALRPALLRVFPPALLGRLTVIPYFPLMDETLERIITLKLNSVARRLRAAQGIEMGWSPAVLALIRARCTEIESGGRMIDAILNDTLLPAISRAVLGALAERRGLGRVAIDVSEGEFTYDIA
jgi:type VI secretion system protein VasG